MIATAATIPDVQEAVRSAPAGMRLLPVGNRTKHGLSSSAREDVQPLSLAGLSGVLEYDPAELTLTALAGTPLVEVQAALDEHRQYLPFDPPLTGAGATIGGNIAAGLAGSGAWRHGGVRDFVIGVRFVDGTGRLITGGGKVVKNAAGFDLPKLMVGSIGRLGAIVQLSFKVFPRPPATTTLEFVFDSPTLAVAASLALARGPVQLDALDIVTNRVLARIAGRAESLESRASRLLTTLDAPAVRHNADDEQALWQEAAELRWRAPDSHLVYVGLSIRRLAALDDALADVPGAVVRFGVGGTVAWIAWPVAQPLDDLHAVLSRLDLPGLVVFGPPDRPLLGPRTGGAFGERVTGALDPDSRFMEV